MSAGHREDINGGYRSAADDAVLSPYWYPWLGGGRVGGEPYLLKDEAGDDVPATLTYRGP